MKTFFPNVKISGTMIGALPVGLKGKLYGQPFKVLVQYDAFGGVRTQVYEDDDRGGLIFELTGRTGETEPQASGFGTWALLRAKKENKDNYPWNTNTDWAKKEQDKIERDIRKRALEFVKNLHKETKDFNSGKDTKTTKVKEKVMLAPKKTKAPAKPKKKIDFRTIDVKGYCVEPHKRKIKIMIGGL